MKRLGIVGIIPILLLAIFLGRAHWDTLTGSNKKQQVKNFVDCAPLKTAEPVNIATIKDQVKMYRASGLWEKAIECVVHQAIKELQKYSRVQGKFAAIFDIDDTVLSNWDFILKSDFGYNTDRFKRWEQSAQCLAIEPVRKVFDVARKLNIAAFGITGRREDQRQATQQNLEAVGFVGWAGLYFKPMDYNESSAIGFKSKWRKHIQDQGYTIILNIGDQMSDLLGNPQAYTNFKISNPMYIIP